MYVQSMTMIYLYIYLHLPQFLSSVSYSFQCTGFSLLSLIFFLCILLFIILLEMGLFSWFLSDCFGGIEIQLSSLYWFLYPANLLNLLMSSKILTPWQETYDQLRYHIQKQRHYFANKGPSSQGYGFSSGHVSMWNLNCEESWAPKNWCFWTVVLEKTLQSPLNCKQIQPVYPKGNKSWIFLGSTDAEAKTLILWPSNLKSWLIGKDSDTGRDCGQEENGKTEDEMAGWHHRLNGHKSGWTPGTGDGQGGLACCNSWSSKESDTTEWLNWTELTNFLAEALQLWWTVQKHAQEKLPHIRGQGWQLGRATTCLRSGAAAEGSNTMSKEQWWRRHRRA